MPSFDETFSDEDISVPGFKTNIVTPKQPMPYGPVHFAVGGYFNGRVKKKMRCLKMKISKQKKKSNLSHCICDLKIE